MRDILFGSLGLRLNTFYFSTNSFTLHILHSHLQARLMMDLLVIRTVGTVAVSLFADGLIVAEVRVPHGERSRVSRRFSHRFLSSCSRVCGSCCSAAVAVHTAFLNFLSSRTSLASQPSKGCYWVRRPDCLLVRESGGGGEVSRGSGCLLHASPHCVTAECPLLCTVSRQGLRAQSPVRRNHH